MTSQLQENVLQADCMSLFEIMEDTICAAGAPKNRVFESTFHKKIKIWVNQNVIFWRGGGSPPPTHHPRFRKKSVFSFFQVFFQFLLLWIEPKFSVFARSALYVRTPQVKSPKSVLLLFSSSPPDYNRFLRVAYGGVDTLSAPRWIFNYFWRVPKKYRC